MVKNCYLFLLLLIFAVSASSANYDNDTIFPTPTILKDNVAFWIKIYTEVPMSEGLIHDRNYPLVIFEQITNSRNKQKIKARKKAIALTLSRIATKSEKNLTSKERQIIALYKAQASREALEGAANRVRFQMGQMERFKRGLERSGMFLDTIRKIMKSYGVPLRLAYLPHVESSFNTEAYSKVGAAGLWQFMRGTGKLFGMRIDYTIDERRDPIIASKAAAKYLSDSYQQLHAWPLAITSYNHGVYGMKRAIAQTGSNDLAVIIQNYKSRSFKFASSNFYSCFLAASEIAENHEKYFPTVKLRSPLRFTDFVVDHYIGADVFCNHIGIAADELMHLNPAIRPAVFTKHQQLPKGYTLHLPAAKSIEEITAAYKTIPDSLMSSSPPRPQYYRVNRGDNLYAIATRLNVPIKELALENNITRINRIRAGQLLRVPTRAGVKQKVTPAEKPTVVAAALPVPQKEKPQTVLTPKQDVEKNTPQAKTDTLTTDALVEIAQAEAQAILPPEEQPVADHSPTGKTRQLSKKYEQKQSDNIIAPPALPALTDTLRDIALSPAVVEPEKTSTEKPQIASNFNVAIYDLDATLSSAGNSAKIVVSIDETIGHYADWLNIPTWRIRKLNDMGRKSDIRVNRSLLIPIDQPDALEKFAASRLEYHMAIEEDFYSQFKITEIQSHTVKKGETLWDLCNDNDNQLPLWVFTKYNRQLDLAKLYPRSIVWIPVIGERTEEEMAVNPTGIQSSPRRPNPLPYHKRLMEIERVP